MDHSSLCAAMTASTVLSFLCIAYIAIHLDVVLANRRPTRYGHHDAIHVTRCEARCWHTPNRSSCVKACLLKGAEKPGRCPNDQTLLSPFAVVCLDACQKDAQCPGLTKCCRHSCGVTCQQAEELASLRDIPEVPKDVRITEGRKKRTVYIEWKPGGTNYKDEGGGKILYLIEERHHAGRNFIEKKLSEWTPCARASTTNLILKNFVRPGSWYQFRVAAVNENGTKGFSDSSVTFSVSTNPKPPKLPRNMTVGPLWTFNDRISAELRWLPPQSDLPIQRYKVFWSRRLHGAKVLDSVLVYQQVVPRDQTKFLLQDLEPNSLYFLQVQAFSQFGKERLKSEKAALILNTTNYTNVSDSNPDGQLSVKGRVEGLHLQRLFLIDDDLKAEIVWKSKKGPMKYTVSWWSAPCHQNHKNYSYFKFAVTTKASHYDLFNLQFNCKYRVSVREISIEGMKHLQDSSITFITPTYDDYKLSYRKARCLNNADADNKSINGK